MQRWWTKTNRRVLRALLLLVTALLLTYYIPRLLDTGWDYFKPGFWLDERLPFVPEFVLIYFGSYVYWVVGFIVVGKQGEQPLYELLTAVMLSFGVCLLCFIFLPATIERPQITGDGFWNWMTSLLYSIDTPNCLFPSMHCLNSWVIYLAVRGKQTYPRWLKITFCVLSLLIFASTVLVKQHFVADVVAGVLVAEVAMLIVGKCKLGARVGQVLNRTLMRGL